MDFGGGDESTVVGQWRVSDDTRERGDLVAPELRNYFSRGMSCGLAMADP